MEFIYFVFSSVLDFLQVDIISNVNFFWFFVASIVFCLILRLF